MHTKNTTEEMASTRNFSKFFDVEPGTLRRAFCTQGHYLGIKPVKLENGRLLWSVAEGQRVREGRA